jgi:hypothetical protein
LTRSETHSSSASSPKFGHDRGAAVRHERERDAGQRQQLVTPRRSRTPEADRERQAGREQLREPSSASDAIFMPR